MSILNICFRGEIRKYFPDTLFLFGAILSLNPDILLSKFIHSMADTSSQ